MAAWGSEVPSISGSDGSLSGPKILLKIIKNETLILEYLLGLDKESIL